VLRIEPLKTDQAPSAILELVDGPKDMRFAMTAKTVARCAKEDKDLNELTLKNIKKVTQFRENGQEELEEMVEKLKSNKLA
jgi:large subunit ribosomal protein L17